MSDHSHSEDVKTVTIAETDNFLIWTAAEPGGETTYNLELGTVTLHLFQEEWEELVALIRSVKKS